MTELSIGVPELILFAAGSGLAFHAFDILFWIPRFVMTTKVLASSRILPDPPMRFLMFDLDVCRLVSIDRECFDADSRWSVDDFREHLSIGCQFAVYDAPHRGVVGYVVFYVAPGKRLELVRFAVRPTAQGHGVGKQLLRWPLIVAEHAKINDAVCDLSEDLLPAQKLLRSVGFRYIETLPEDCRTHENADVYRFRMNVELCGD